jgi:hypothetical protein
MAELPLEAAEPAATGQAARHPVRSSGPMSGCARPSEDLVCDACKSRIRAEAIYLRAQDDKAVR